MVIINKINKKQSKTQQQKTKQKASVGIPLYECGSRCEIRKVYWSTKCCGNKAKPPLLITHFINFVFKKNPLKTDEIQMKYFINVSACQYNH